MEKNIDNLLARYFGGNASEADMKELDNWISMSAENQQFFDQSTTLYEKLYNSQHKVPSVNTVDAKRMFMNHISAHTTNQSTPNVTTKHIAFYKKWMFQAASVALLLMMSFAGWSLFFSDREMVLATQMVVKNGTLPDNTNVTLSKNSKIRYSSKFGKKTNIIKLEGEANFDVGRAGSGTLQIQASETYIEDIGTVFSVTAYPDSNFISVKVSEGTVRFYTKSNKGIILNASETGTYDKQTKTFHVLAKKIDKDAAVGAMHIQFQEMLLNDAIDIIKNAYNVNIVLADKAIGERKITVSFDGEDVQLVLQIIAETLNLEIKKRNNGFELSNQIVQQND